MENKTLIPVSRLRIGLLIFLGILAIFLALNAVLIIPYMLAILIGVMLKVLVNAPFCYLRGKGVGPKISAALVVTGILVLLVGPLSLFLTVAVKQAITLGQWLSQHDMFSIRLFIREVAKIGPIDNLFGGAEALERQIRIAIQEKGLLLTTAVLSAAGQLPSLALHLVVSLITCFFLLLDGRRFVNWIADKIPLEPEVQEQLTQSFKDTSISVVWSSLAAAAAQASMMFVAFWVIGVPGAFLAAGATFLFSWIPIVGSGPVWIAGAVYLYLKGSLIGMFFMAGSGLLIGVADNIVRTMVLKGRSNMHPLVSLIAILGGIRLFGILGVFVGPVLAGILKTLLQIWPVVGRRFGVLEELGDKSTP